MLWPQANSQKGKDKCDDAYKSICSEKGGIDPGHIVFGNDRVLIKKKYSYYKYPHIIDHSKRKRYSAADQKDYG